MWGQIFNDTYRANTWSAASMRNAESLMQIEMRHISSKFSWLTQTNHRIQVGSINVNLTAMIMNNVAYFGNCCFKDSMRRRIGDHDGSQFIRILRSFFL